MLYFLVAGILCCNYFSLPYILIYSLLALTIITIIYKKSIADILLLFIIFSIGNTLNIKTYTKYNPQDNYQITTICTKQLKHNNYILKSNNQLFYLSSYNIDTVYSIGDSLNFCTKITPLKILENPNEFNYNEYLQKEGVYYQLHPTSKIKILGKKKNTVSIFAQLRNKLLIKSAKLTKDTIPETLINTLCLGYKQDIDKELHQLFLTTGTVHLLSVSGLHTGAIYLILSYILKTIGLRSKKASLLTLPLLWGYACLTGLSPSVIRAATILSFITIGTAFNKNSTPINSLCAAAFFTLIISPLSIYSLSFLMSYAAYSGIILIYPKLIDLLHKVAPIPSPIVSHISSAIAITISAQLLTLPISAYYFHTININGFLANIVAVPLATIILYFASILMLLPTSIGLLIVPAFEKLVGLLVRFLTIISPISVNINNLYPDKITIIAIYILFIILTAYYISQHRYWMYIEYILIITLTAYLGFKNYNISQKSELTIFHYYKESAIVFNHQGYYYDIYNNTNKNSIPKTEAYKKQNKLQTLSDETIKFKNAKFSYQNNYLISKHDTIFIANSKHKNILACNTLIITDNIKPEVLYSFSKTNYPKTIILDGSNHKYTLNEWEQFSNTNNLKLNSTMKLGCIILSLK